MYDTRRVRNAQACLLFPHPINLGLPCHICCLVDTTTHHNTSSSAVNLPHLLKQHKPFWCTRNIIMSIACSTSSIFGTSLQSKIVRTQSRQGETADERAFGCTAHTTCLPELGRACSPLSVARLCVLYWIRSSVTQLRPQKSGGLRRCFCCRVLQPSFSLRSTSRPSLEPHLRLTGESNLQDQGR